MTFLERLIDRYGVVGVAERFGVHPQTVRRWRREGLPSFRKPAIRKAISRLGKKKRKAKPSVKLTPSKKRRKKKPSKPKVTKAPKPVKPSFEEVSKILPPEAAVPSPPPEVPKAIVTTAEIMAERLNRHFRAYLEQTPYEYGVVSASGRPYGRAYTIQRGGRDGLILTQWVNLRVTTNTIERIARAVIKDIESLQNALPGGEMFVTLSLFEYGSQFIGQSPNSTAFGDDEGTLVTSYVTTRGHYNVDRLAETLRRELRRLARHERSAVKVESYTVRIYR